MRRIGKFLAATALCVSAAGCATADPGAAVQNDPFEKTNRFIFKTNMKLDKAVAKPVSKFYVRAVPAPIRNGIHNVLENLNKPVVFGNDVLQGEMTRAGQTFTRFVTNSTLGVGGIFDVATSAGVPDHDEDFGQTLGVWGVGEGPYLVLPFAGPSNPRDVVGKAGDFFMDPLFYARFNYDDLASDLRMGFSVIDTRSRALDTTDQLERSSLDYYATVRSLYRQYRKAEIANGDPNELPPDADDPLDEPQQ